MALSSFVSMSVLMDFDNDGTFEEDVSSDVLSLSTERGRSEANSEFEPGTGTLVLRNRDGRYSMFDATSPLWPNVLPKRPIKAEVTYNAVTYPLFYGFATPSDQGTTLARQEVEWELFDQFEEWRLGRTNTPLAVNQRTDPNLTDVLDDIGFAAGRRQLDTGLSTMEVWTNHNRLPINALSLIVRSEAGGRHYMAKNGDYVFENREHRSKESIYATLAGTFDDLRPQVRQDELRDSVRATWVRHKVATVNTPVFMLDMEGFELPPGLTTIAVTFEDDQAEPARIGAQDAVTPVANTDYHANSQADGSGVDKTSQVQISAFTQTSSGSAEVTLNNLDSASVYLAGTEPWFQVRGKAITIGNETLEYKRDATAPVVSNQRLGVHFDFLSDRTTVQNWVNLRAAVLGKLRARPVVSITPDTDALMATVLGAELSHRVALQDTGAFWQSQIDDQFHIERIAMQFDAERLNEVKATWLLFDEDLGMGDGLVFDDPDSKLVTTGAEGKRIWI